MEPDLSARLREAFVAVYSDYIAARLEEKGYQPPEGWDDAVSTGRAWLDDALRVLLAKPFREQRRSPLEVFQEALAEPTRVLAAAGTPAPPRDEVQVRALPGDVYDLAPASSQELGESVWEVHLQWGATKAKAITGPAVAYVGGNLMDRSQIQSAAERRHLSVLVWRSVDEIERGLATSAVVRAFVDLTHEAADDALRRLAETRIKVIAFGPHVDDIAITRARSLGAADAVARSSTRRPPSSTTGRRAAASRCSRA